ncbi:MAG: hypothetical protein DWQ44_11675 [Bacteroidetes bacterium]|nr:MAG: hypothetical protein DWQ33_10640 [Bacteroidota bacterium]REK05280.1 MAG: hypothetical protein DWQ39_08805 [Bacteroidota bacterium]REK32685.1 MAG: hypothetical protein DWQ44_11675 [Bacteroidota bacterium]REK48868.1 MAG: hypothetical protein DWQ48_08285 [Bacteroidota bacterium]
MKTASLNRKTNFLSTVNFDENKIRMHDSELPVLKINRNGRIIYSNSAATPLLKMWNCVAKNIIPSEILKMYPSILSRNANEVIELLLEAGKMKFGLCSRRGSGYTLLFGFQPEKIKLSESTC